MWSVCLRYFVSCFASSDAIDRLGVVSMAVDVWRTEGRSGGAPSARRLPFLLAAILFVAPGLGAGESDHPSLPCLYCILHV